MTLSNSGPVKSHKPPVCALNSVNRAYNTKSQFDNAVLEARRKQKNYKRKLNGNASVLSGIRIDTGPAARGAALGKRILKRGKSTTARDRAAGKQTAKPRIQPPRSRFIALKKTSNPGTEASAEYQR